MKKILVADNAPRDAQRFSTVIESAGLEVKVCVSGEEVAGYLNNNQEQEQWAAIILLWELPGSPFGSELLVRFRRSLPGVPVVVVSNALDAALATRAFALGARDFLEKPLDMQRVKSCIDSLLSESDPYSASVMQLNKTILGDSPALLSTLKQVVKTAQHNALRVLLIGESGTGKELMAQAIHELSSNSARPFVAVNVAAIPKDLIESAVFGHEKGAFTGAISTHQGYMEEADDGTLFLDEFGELDLSLQVKLLRVIQQKKFRRLKGNKDINFRARLVCATNRDLALEVRNGFFRRDLFHRIAEVTIQIPPLRERKGDVNILLEYFLSLYRGERPVRFARETLTIINSYPFHGNVRELENFVRAALMQCDGDFILPRHLPLPTMGTFLDGNDEPRSKNESSDAPFAEPEFNNTQAASPTVSHQELFSELARTLPHNWLELPYKQVTERCEHALDRIYLPHLIKQHKHNVTKATKAAGVDKKTFAQHWKAAGLSPLRSEEGDDK